MTAWTPHYLLSHLTLPPTGYRPQRGHIDVWTLHANPDTTICTQRLKALLGTTERRRASGFLIPAHLMMPGHCHVAAGVREPPPPTASASV